MRCTVLSSALPTITWRCPGCHRTEPFACSERFRANANGKLVDIWLIYRCTRCEATKNLTVVERTPVRRLDPDLLRAAEENDGPVARRLARDVDLLRRNGAAVAAGDAWVLAATAEEDDGGAGDGALELHLDLPEPLLVRLDALVAGVVGRSRREVRDALRLPPGAPRADSLRLWRSLSLVLPPRVRASPDQGAPRRH